MMLGTVRTYSIADMPRAWSRKAYDSARRCVGAGGGAALMGGSATAGRKKNAGGVGPSTTPSFHAAAAAVPGGTGTVTPALPTNSTGDLFLCIVGHFAESGSPSLPAGWSAQGSATSGSFKLYLFTRDTRSTGGESGTINVNVASSSDRTQILSFSNVATSSFIEGAANVAGSAGSCGGPSITSTGTARLACAFYWADGTAAGANSGSSGGTWTPANVNFDGVNLLLQLQTCAIGAATISGGTTTFTAGGFGSVCRGFALIGV